MLYLSISFRRTNKGPNKKLESPISRYHYVPGLGKSLRVNTRVAQELWGRAGDLIKQTYCV